MIRRLIRIATAIMVVVYASTLAYSQTSISPLVRSVFGEGNASSNGTCILPNVNLGDVIVTGATVFNGDTLTGLSDSFSDSWALADSNTNVVATNLVTKVWVTTAISSGSLTITYTGSYSAYHSDCTELSGSLVTSTIDSHSNGTFLIPASVTLANGITSTVSADVLYTYMANNSGTSTIQPVTPMAFMTGDGISGMSHGAGMEVLGAAGSYSSAWKMDSQNSGGNYVQVALKPSSSLAIATIAIPTGKLSTSYSFPLYAVGALSGLTWSKLSGSLFGMSLNSSTGVISGTPSSGGTSSVNIQVTDGTNTTTKSFTLTINATASTPTFIQGKINTLASTLAFTSVAVGDVIVTQTIHRILGVIVYPTDTLGTIYHPLGEICDDPAIAAECSLMWAGQATGSGADTVTAGADSVSGTQFRGVQGIYDPTSLTSFNTTGTSATVTSGSLTTPTPNSMVFAVLSVNPGNPTLSINSPFTESATSSGSENATEVGYDLVSSVGSITSSFPVASISGTWSSKILMVALRPSTSGPVATGVPRHKTPIF